MLLYALTLAGVIALVAVGWLQRSREPGTYRYLVYGRLKTLLAALVLTGLFCSAVQLAILLSNDYEGTRQALAPIQSRLRFYRVLSRWFTLTGAQIATFALAIVALTIAAFAGVKHSIPRFVSTWKRAYAVAASVAFLALFGTMVASDDAFVQRLALAERHAK